MKFYVKNKFLSWGGSSEVLNENKEPIYKVKGKVFSITRKKYICDMEDNRLFMVRNKYWHLFLKSAFIYDAEGNKLLKVKRKFAIKNDYSVQGTEDEYAIDGSVFGWNFSVIKNGEVIGTIKRELNFIVNSFEVNVENPENAPFMIAFVIAIDNIVDRSIR